ncbi:MAG: peptidoglycan binding domain-containing protein [Anaerolineae bacterium]|nr:peptidoglycan binding domain-containing protein [Anaerolineae bacterium]
MLPAIAFVSLFLVSIFWGGRIPPNVFILDVALGGLPHDAAAEALETAWSQDIVIRFTADNREWETSPTGLGLHLDAQSSVQATHGLGLAGLPFGYWLDPAVSVDQMIMRQYLEALAEDVYVAPINARYEWQNGAVAGIAGQNGIALDVDATLSGMLAAPLDMLTRDVSLVTTELQPAIASPDSLLERAQRFVSAPFELTAYDPFEDRQVSFTASPETLSTWIEAGESSLVARNAPVSDYVNSLNSTAATGSSQGGFLDTQEVIDAINLSLAAGITQAQVQMRFNPTTYEVVAGDTGYRIARKTGIPFFLIEEANPGRDLGVLSVGDVINLPSRDVTLPLPVVANKRIVVDLETQSLVAFEDGQVVLNWQISSGIDEAPTSPGIYQILSHEPVAYGSSYTLCGDAGCGQWEMNWFMGIYEAVPGLVNGFHGAVLLPNGGYLGGNTVGTPYTLGCVMSQDEQARQLYDWADEGTIVEIISSEFPPQSELARQVGARASASDDNLSS